MSTAAPSKHKKSFGDWLDDTLLAMQVSTSVSNDELYDTDAPDLPVATQTAETYNNFRQWLEWDGATVVRIMPTGISKRAGEPAGYAKGRWARLDHAPTASFLQETVNERA